MYMFSVIRITESVSGDIVYEERLSASPFAMRPVFLIHAKEERENLEDVRKTVIERQNVPSFEVTTENGSYHQITLVADLSCIYAKMRGLLTGLGGAFCLLYTIHRDTANG